MGAKKNTGFPNLRCILFLDISSRRPFLFARKSPPLFPQTERAKKNFRHLHKGNNKTFLNEKGYCTYGRIHQGWWWSDAREKGEDVKPDSGWPASAVVWMDQVYPSGIHFSQLLLLTAISPKILQRKKVSVSVRRCHTGSSFPDFSAAEILFLLLLIAERDPLSWVL